MVLPLPFTYHKDFVTQGKPPTKTKEFSGMIKLLTVQSDINAIDTWENIPKNSVLIAMLPAVVCR